MGVPREGVVWTLGVVRGLIYILEGTKGYIYIYIYTHTHPCMMVEDVRADRVGSRYNHKLQTVKPLNWG
jgi:hypothetical protein